MPGKQCPCRGCTERILLCHGRCEKYQTWKKEYENAKTAARSEVPDFPRAMMKHAWKRMKEGRIRK